MDRHDIVGAAAPGLVTPALTKDRSTLAAKLALAGFMLVDMADGGYLVMRWGCARQCADLEEVARFARRVGAE